MTASKKPSEYGRQLREKQKVKREVKFDVNQMIGTLTTALTGFATLYLLINR